MAKRKVYFNLLAFSSLISLHLVLIISPVLSQEFRGSLVGRVTEKAGAVIPGATLKVINTETNVARESITNDQGTYRVPFLTPGNYRVSVSMPGFKTVETTVRISAGSDTTLDFALEVGEISETITVEGTAPLINTTNADLGQVIESSYIEYVTPSLTRNVMNRVMLSAAVTGETGTYTSNAQSNFSISGGGSKRGGNEIMVDGIPNTVPQSGGIALFVPSLDMVEEMKIHTTMFDSSLGHSNGGAINIVTRGGTNRYHGSAYNYRRFRALNANSWANNRLGLERGPVSYNQYGGVFSGPVQIPGLYKGRDRTFFLASYESDLEDRDETFEARVPTDLERKGDFSQTLNRLGTRTLEIYDPLTTTGTGSAARRTEFPNSTIPASRITATGRTVAGLYPLPNQPGPAQIGRYNWAFAGIVAVSQKQFSARVDQVISERQKMFARFSRLKRRQAVDDLFPGAFSTPVGENLGTEWRTFDSVALDDTITFSPSLQGSLRYGFVERSSPRNIPTTLLDPSPLSLAAIILDNQATKAFPRFQLGENFAEFGSSKREERWYSHTVLATFYKIMGKHSLKFGTDYRMIRQNTDNPGNSASGSFTYNSTFTRGNPFVTSSADTSGTALASLLLGVPASGSLGFSTARSFQNHYLALFVQEDWKVVPKLTLNFGVRWELETPYTERFDRVAYGFDFNAPSPIAIPGLNVRGGILFAGVAGNPRTTGNLDKNNFGPRFGFAYSLNPKTVLRGGYGFFYSAHTFNTSFAGAVATFDATTNYTGSTDNGATPFTTLANPFPSGLRAVQGSSLGLAARYGDSLTVLDQDRVNPYNQQWQLSIQRELPGEMVVEVAYAGMRSLKQLEAFNLNEKPDRFLTLGQAENTRVNNPFFGLFDPTSSLGGSNTVVQSQLWKMFPQYGTLTLEGANTGRAIYHGLQSRVEKRFSHGLRFLLSYAYSKLIDNNTTSWVNERHYRSVSDLDVRHLMRLSTVYELPFGPGRPLLSSSKGVIARVLEGWIISGYLNAQSGAPLSITHSLGRPIVLRNPSKSGSVSERLGLNVDPATGKVLNPYFDIDAFAPLASQYTISPTEPFLDWLRGPGRWNLNLSLIKNVSLTEDVRFQLRFDATNATNSPSWGNPGTDMSNLANFGVIRSGGGGRSMQLGLRLTF
jgi:hypothetical protein